ncbi:MAG: DUF4332 domain-containing protein [Anaerolineae bacterium]
MTSLIDVEGIGEAYAGTLKQAGVATLEGLLAQGASPAGRADLAERTGISGKLLLQWVNHADMYRIKGIGSEYADLLEACGVDTVPELAQRVPANLCSALAATNESKKLVRRVPVLSQVEDWVAQAKQLPRIITY